ncbi:tetratricopeptide repeat protein [Streptomyces sp. NPDC002619]|uniref:tetratricopeptide repeat protein n=1 Tax=Streptomyces sp. NPDC002619 TaxID=3364655 RepID=UPI0036C9A893
MKRDETTGGRGQGRSPGSSQRPIPRPVVPPGPLGTLKRLIYEAYVAAGTPTLSAIADATDRWAPKARPSKDMINQIIGDPTELGKQADVVALVTALTQMTGGEGEQAGLRAAALWTEVKLTEPLGRPIADVDPYDLEVHHAITMQGADGLPDYVERAHDRELRRLVDEAAAGESRLVMLVGTSSTGKTRACYEAVQHLPEGWRLWHPINPERAQAALADLERVGPKTVVWLNEAHRYLLDAQHGEAITAGLRTLLADTSRAPVLVLGTIWPGAGFFDDLRKHPQAGTLVADRSLHVPAAFEPSVVDRLRQSTDPRLVAAAHSAPANMITQYLAAAFELKDVYETATPGARALLDAAIDARRLGHPVNLPLPFLETAAEGYLTEPEWQLLPGNWLEQALSQLTESVRGVPGPLHRPKRPRGSTEAPIGSAYQLADFLEDHGRATRHLARVPAEFWQAAERHCGNDAARNLAQEALKRGLMKTACCLWASGSQYRDAVLILERAGRRDEAMAWCEREAAVGNAEALTAKGGTLARAGRVDEAIDCYKRAVDAGDTGAIEWIATRLSDTGHLDEALEWYERAADAGDVHALVEAAHCLNGTHHRRGLPPRVTDRLDEALAWYERAAAAGHTDAFLYAAADLWGAGRTEEALDWCERAASAGATDMLGWGASQLAWAGRLDEASAWCTRAADKGDTENLREAADAFAHRGRAEDAVTWYERAADNGDIEAQDGLTERLTDAVGGLDGALAWCERKASAGGTYALRVGAIQLTHADRLDKALEWAERAAASGETFALWYMAGQLVDTDRLDEALGCYERAANAGDTRALLRAAEELARHGRLEDALAWCKRVPEAGDAAVLTTRAGVLWQMGRVEEALACYGRAGEAGDIEALEWAAARLENAGRLDDALAWYERAAAAGKVLALTTAADELAKAGRRQEALAWYERATTAGVNARAYEVDTLRLLGRREEADRLARYGRDIRGHIANPWNIEAVREAWIPQHVYGHSEVDPT